MKFGWLYLSAFAAAFVTALASLPAWRKWCLQMGVVDDPGHRKIHEQPMPLAGGLAVFMAFAFPAALGLAAIFLSDRFSTNLPLLDADAVSMLKAGIIKRGMQLAAFFAGAIGMLVVGLLDDKHELRPATKFTCQFAVALLVAASGARVTLFVPSLIFSYAITILWILTVINAFNFMDNMNGLCGGLGAIGAFYFALAAVAAGQHVVALVAFLTCGALTGFLPYNFPRAKAFLGDSGSHLVGYLLAVLAILPSFYTPEHPRGWAVLDPLFILAIPLGDLVWVVLLRWRMGKPFYVGDNNHLSHRLVQLGWTRTVAVFVIWLLAAVIGIVTLL